MNLVEFEAKALLRDAGLPLPTSFVLRHDQAAPEGGDWVVKAQVPHGGRGKLGLVVMAGQDDVKASVSLVRQRMRDRGWIDPILLLEQPVQAASEAYLAWRIDDVSQSYELTFSSQGGVDVESAQADLRHLKFAPNRIPATFEFIDFFESLGYSGRIVAELARIASATWHVFLQNDAHLLEINPVAITPRGEVVLVDAKIVLDDNARRRHTSWSALYSKGLEDAGLTDLERRALAGGLTFLELEGETAVISGGAGLGMALLDMLADAGMPAANFVDTSGGSAASVYELRTQLVFERAARPDVKAILLYLTVAASSIARHVNTLIEILDRRPPPKPLVVGLLCAGAAEREMTFGQAKALFESRGYPCASDLAGVMDALLALRRS